MASFWSPGLAGAFLGETSTLEFSYPNRWPDNYPLEPAGESAVFLAAEKNLDRLLLLLRTYYRPLDLEFDLFPEFIDWSF